MPGPVYSRSIELMEAPLGDELVGLDAKAGFCFGFNEVATSVWRSLERPKRFEDLRRELLEQYDVDEEQCAIELRELLANMLAKGLITQERAPGNKEE